MVDNTKKDQKKYSYKFKYIYLALGLLFITFIIATYILPKSFPQLFTDSSWVIVNGTALREGEIAIEHIPESTAMMIINIIRDVSISGFVGVLLYAFYEYRFAKDEKETLINDVNTILSENIELHVIHAMFASKNVNMQMLSSEWIDEVLYNCLVRKTGDEGKADAIMKTLLENIINQSMTIWDLDVFMALNNFSDTKHHYCAYSTYRMNYVIRYKVLLNADNFTFILTNNQSIQSDNLGAFAFCQFIDSAFSGQEVYFKVNQITIDDIPLSLQDKREVDKNYIKERYWNERCSGKKGERVQVVYSVEFLIRRKGNHYSYFTPAMTSGVHLKFDASKTDIRRIKLLPYFNSRKKPTILYEDEDKNNPKVIDITLSDWVLPLSGAAFIWQFEGK